MIDRSTEALLEELAHDLRPVRTLPRLRVVALETVVAWGLVVVAQAVASVTVRVSAAVRSETWASSE